MIGLVNKGGVDTSDATANANDIKAGKTAYVNDEKITGTSQALDIDGIIEEYTAGGNISAGGFVEFMNKELGNNTKISTGSTGNAIKLSDNKVFVSYISGTGNTASINFVIATIANTSILLGTPLNIPKENIGGIPSLTSLTERDDKEVFVLYRSDISNYSCNIYGMLCSISNDTITAHNAITVVNSANDIGKVVRINSNKVFIAYGSSGQTPKLSVCVCNIYYDGTITKGGIVTLTSSNSTGYNYSVVSLNENKVFIAYSRLYPLIDVDGVIGIICTISGTNVTFETGTLIKAGKYFSNSIDTVKLAEDKVFLAYGYDETTNYSYMCICQISGTNIIYGNETILSINGNNTISALLLANNKVFVSYQTTIPTELYTTICTISGAEITRGSVTRLCTTEYSLIQSILISINKVLICNKISSGTFDFSCVVDIPETIPFPITSLSQTIGGIAKTSGSEGDTVQVYVPNIS